MSSSVCVARVSKCVLAYVRVCVCKYLSCKHIKFTVVGVASAYFKSFSLYSARVYLAHKGSTDGTCLVQGEGGESMQHILCVYVCVCV